MILIIKAILFLIRSKQFGRFLEEYFNKYYPVFVKNITVIYGICNYAASIKQIKEESGRACDLNQSDWFKKQPELSFDSRKLLFEIIK